MEQKVKKEAPNENGTSAPKPKRTKKAARSLIGEIKDRTPHGTRCATCAKFVNGCCVALFSTSAVRVCEQWVEAERITEKEMHLIRRYAHKRI